MREPEVSNKMANESTAKQIDGYYGLLQARNRFLVTNTRGHTRSHAGLLKFREKEKI